MKRWGWALALVLAACIPIFVTRSTNVGLLDDSDTVDILRGIEQRQNPWSWFAGDWPLGNHFYRPITSLTFELDQKLHPGSGAGFGTTNAILAIACVWMLFWFLRELTDSPALTGASTALFATWVFAPFMFAPVVPALTAVAGLALLVSVVTRRQTGFALAGLCLAYYASTEFAGLLQIRGGSLDWLPGRTATTMTIFALAGMAMYARYVRLTGSLVPRALTPYDRPATKSTLAPAKPGKAPWLWVVGAVVASAAALASYEQAVMIPACIVGIAVAFRLRGKATAWWPHILFWAALGLYLVLRKAVLPPGTSTYQLQQYRSSMDVFFTLTDYVLPFVRPIYMMVNLFEFGFMSFILTQGGNLLAAIASAVSMVFVWKGRARSSEPRDWMPLIACVLSFLAFLPMAWMKQFQAYNHYHFWSMAIRSVYAVSLMLLAWRVVVAGVSMRPVLLPDRSA